VRRVSEVEQKAEARRADGGGQSVLGQHPSKIRTERETNLGNVCCLVNFRRELGPCPSHSLAVAAPEEYKYEVSLVWFTWWMASAGSQWGWSVSIYRVSRKGREGLDGKAGRVKDSEPWMHRALSWVPSVRVRWVGGWVEVFRTKG
jgi:hypothetical protein